ncbi:MAG: hypothetical protein NTV23_12730 [Propionibacteriales bacterium]|nr:hypothetical protein [Propionibacteriales bacterium]
MTQNGHPTALTLALSAGWFTTGALWFVQAVVPWTATGSLSHSSTIDASALIRSGDVGSLAPTFAGWLLLMLPAVGLVLCASAFSMHRVTQAFRVLAAVAALAVSVALTHYLTGFRITDFGPGALLAWLGCVTGTSLLAASVLLPSS